MQGPRAARKEEFKDVIALINKVFRHSGGHNPTMQQEFPLLLNENNIDNMRIIVEDGKPAADVNFLKEDILIEGSKIKAASIGAVCTDPDYRGRGYASLVLDDVEKKMRRDGVDIVLISGDRTLYTRRKCCKVRNFYECIVNSEKNNNVEIIEYNKEFLDEMVHLYNRQSTRYYRSYGEFEILLEAATIPWGAFTYKKYVLLKNGEFEGYIVLRIIDGEVKYGQVIEALGEKNLVHSALSKLASELELDHIKVYCDLKDNFARLFNSDNKKIAYMEGTVKIINFVSFTENLGDYFRQYVSKEILDNIEIMESDNKYLFKINNELLEIDDLEILTRLIFEGNGEKLVSLEDKPLLESFIKNVFPIPFVWPANLNYQ